MAFVKKQALSWDWGQVLPCRGHRQTLSTMELPCQWGFFLHHMATLDKLVHLFSHLYTHPFIHLSLPPSIHPFLHPFIPSSIHLFLHPSIPLSIHASIHPLFLGCSLVKGPDPNCLVNPASATSLCDLNKLFASQGLTLLICKRGKPYCLLH